ncbi:MAG: hypothetical protein E6713_06020 [Sporomusaceae bacterium]|nr:hypothetical protein [Sporomusaceae bacterium]
MLIPDDIAHLTSVVQEITELVVYQKVPLPLQPGNIREYTKRPRNRDEIDFIIRSLDVVLDQIITSIDTEKQTSSTAAIKVIHSSKFPPELLDAISAALKSGEKPNFPFGGA